MWIDEVYVKLCNKTFYLVLARVRSGVFQPKLFEGDIIETDIVRKVMSGTRKRGAMNNLAKLWPIINGYREVPYIIEESVGK